jgi:subtilase family serine protease
MMSVMGMASPLSHPIGPLQPAGFNPSPVGGFSPSQIRHAYGFDQILFFPPTGNQQFPIPFWPGNGAGQTIAIVDAFDNPTIASDLKVFDQQYGLPNPVFTKATPQGLPAVDGGWATEIALDVEWAHAIAPQANILLVEAQSPSVNDLFNAVTYAAKQPGVSVVSMSFGLGEFAGETGYDSVFTTPANHPGVTFVAASGDKGSPPSYPAVSPNVLSVGGTYLNTDAAGNYLSETGWSGSGGGISQYEAKPGYQSGVVQSATQRTNPDVAYSAANGFSVYCTTAFQGTTGWQDWGGTSDAAPQWAALIAIANQGRALYGKGSLWGANYPLYQVFPSSAFNDITTGNNGYAAGPGYDLVTGLGSPKALQVVDGLVSYNPIIIVPIVPLFVSAMQLNGDPGPVMYPSAVEAVFQGGSAAHLNADDWYRVNRRHPVGFVSASTSPTTQDSDDWAGGNLLHPKWVELEGLLATNDHLFP